MRGLALPLDRELLAAVEDIATVIPFRHMTTSGGLKMHVVSTGCGPRQVHDRVPFRYGAPSSVPSMPGFPDSPQATENHARPPMPEVFHSFAIQAATLAGFPRFRPDSGHINRYHAGIKLGLHQDRDENDLRQPIVSVSLGLSAVFLLGGLERSEKPRHILLEHGDVIVWGGPSRLRFHGVQPLKPGSHLLTGVYRYNLTFRKTH
ncbi:alpha-ketoglutarate-dependent dioxygenase AlkB [Acidicapsa ligni]|uniref:alpha-ketoglutarate-dependent dioxygenase AlkB n=1 Tax=Acidicapsa ligni TaxID=542300 RepID=UPI0021DFEF13|nr:alpha-ketoglutarate-dependent dioxygenase AlkB [Acidicapsa ligni]